MSEPSTVELMALLEEQRQQYADKCLQLIAANKQTSELEKIAQYLYSLLDDIDTIDDIAKENNELYRKMVHNAQSARWAVVSERDGYNPVVFKPLPEGVEPTDCQRYFNEWKKSMEATC